MKTSSKLGFSLIELSVVILVIGLLVLGVTQGSRVILASKLKSAQALTNSSPVNSTEGLALWLETTSAQTLQNTNNSYSPSDNEAINSWGDVSRTGLGLVATQSSAKPPAYKLSGINGLPSVFFDAAANGGDGDGLIIPYNAAVNTKNFTLFFVTRALEQSTNWAMAVDSGNNNGVSKYGYSFMKNTSNTAWQFRTADGAAENTIMTSSIAFNKPTIITGTRSDTDMTLFQDGAQVGQLTTSFITNVAGKFAIGCFAGTTATCTASRYYDGDISEIIYFNRNLKTSEREEVEKYLSQKYGISLQ